MERLISDANRVKEANGEMADLSIDSFADVIEAIHIMQEQMNIAGTTQREAMSTIEGSCNAAKAAWENWVTGLGDENANMSELTTNLVDSIVAAASNILPRLSIIAQSILAAVPELFAQIKAALPEEVQGIIDTIESYIPLITGIMSTIGTLFAGLQLANKVKNLMGMVQALWTVLSANPVLTVVSLIAGLAAAFVTAYNTNDEFRAKVDEAWQTIQSTLGPIIEGIVTSIGNFATSLGTTLQPYIDTAITALGNLATTIGTNVGEALQNVGPFIETCATNFSTFASGVADAVFPVVEQLVSNFQDFCSTVGPIVSDFCSSAQSAFEAAWPQIQSTVETVLGAIQSFTDTVMSVIQGIIKVALGLVKGDWKSVFDGLKSIADTIWGAIQTATSTAMGVIQSGIDTAMSTVKGLWDGAWGEISSFLSTTWDSMKDAVSSGISNVVTFFSDLPGQILGALGDVGSLLWNAGSSIMQGLLDGIANGVNGVISFVSGIGEDIAAHKGPEAYDLKLLVPNGGWIMQSLATGLEKAMPVVHDALADITKEISSYDFGTATVEADFAAYKRRLSVIDGGSTASTLGGTTINVNNYSPKSLSERESARQFKQTVRRLALAS